MWDVDGHDCNWSGVLDTLCFPEIMFLTCSTIMYNHPCCKWDKPLSAWQKRGVIWRWLV